MLYTRTLKSAGLTLVVAIALQSVEVRAVAATVGYWRFEGVTSGDTTGEGGWLDDSSANDLDLGISGATPPPTAYTLPGTGPGSGFDDPIPHTGESNAQAADFTANDFGSDEGNFFVNVDSVYDPGDFTIEAYAHRTATSTGEHQVIASHYAAENSRRSFAFAIRENDGGNANELFLFLSEDGDSFETVFSGISLLEDTDYYLAASFDESNMASGVTFYVENLATDTLQTATVGHTITSLNDPSSATPFRIGRLNNALNQFVGYIDEVRFSDMVLADSELLNAAALVPEPSSALMLGLGLCGLGLCRRRRR